MNESQLRGAVKGFLDETAPIIDHISHIEWKVSDGMVQVIFRAVLKRQHESLSSIVEISDAERSYSGVSLLRPACEELIWIKYLRHIGMQEANELLRMLAVVEIGKTLEAQLEYAGPDVMKSIGFPASFIDAQAASVREAKRVILALGKRLKWATKGKAEIPSVFFIAKATNNLELYKFLYHATSKFVHFSVHELMRRVWGRPGNLSISSDTYARYWSAFSLRWGLQIYLETLIEGLAWVDDQSGPALSEAKLTEAAEIVRKFGSVPIITAEELNWPFPSES